MKTDTQPLVICPKHKTCILDHKNCEHRKPHKHKSVCDITCTNDSDTKCIITPNEIRKQKLLKLNQTR